MKILYVAIKYHQGNPDHGYSFEHNAFYKSLLKLDDASHEILYFPFDVIMLERGKHAMNSLLIERAKQIQPDLCFFSLISDEISPFTIRALKDSGIPTVGWFGDDQFRFESHSRFYAPEFSCIATTWPDAVPKYIALGHQHVFLTTWGVNTDMYHPVSEVKDIDVSFIGSWNKEREKIITCLRKSGIAVMVRGQGWPQGRVGEDEIVDIISRSKIHLGLNSPSFYIGFRPLMRLFLRWEDGFRRSLKFVRPDFHNFIRNVREWWQKKIPQLKARVFEVSACRTLLITRPVDTLAVYYTDNQEVILYSDTADLVEKIRYYLLHADERETVARAGYERTVRDHTYTQRFKVLFQAMGFLPASAPAKTIFASHG